MSGEKLTERFDRLVNRLLAGTVVPFLGAGVSYDAKPSESAPSDCKGFSPKTSHLTRRLIALIKQKIPALNDGEKGQITSLLECPPSLDKRTEIAVYLCGEKNVAEQLRISCFTRLSPTPTHRYPAFLAREGIETLVVTNRDHCHETIYTGYFVGKSIDREQVRSLSPIPDYRDCRQNLDVFHSPINWTACDCLLI